MPELDRTQLYVGGRWVDPAGGGALEVVESSTGEVLATVPEGSAEDVDRAVTAARDAQAAWAATPTTDRIDAVEAVADGLAARSDELAELMAREVGMPVSVSGTVQVGLPITDLRTTAAVARDFPFQEEVGSSLVVREPVGVVGCITPWNYPLHQIAAKVGPAIAVGCAVVVKPSEVAPLNAFVLAEVVHEVGVPAGVFNLVTGLGTVAGEAIAAHPGVDMVSLTGSVRAGRRVAEVAAGSIKRVTLELGGKSPYVLLDDLDGEALQQAVANGVRKCFFNSGQTCSAFTRMLVPASRKAEIEDLVVEAVKAFPVGDPLDPQSALGPVVSGQQRERVRGYIEKGLDEGARLLVGGGDPPAGLDRGFYVQPTVFTDVHNGMTIAREEIFGPVLSIIAYRDDDEAVSIANDTEYGLSAGVWGGDEERARAVALRIESGQVEVNGGRYNPLAPFGGYKQSGYGRELGRFGLEEYLQVKSLQL